jgi:hypothetical protein
MCSAARVDRSAAYTHVPLGVLTHRLLEVVVIFFFNLLTADGRRPGIEAPFECSGLRGLRFSSKLFGRHCGEDVMLIRCHSDAIAPKALAVIQRGIGCLEQSFRQRAHIAPCTP